MATRNSKSTNGSRLPAVGYVRMSTDRQVQSSIRVMPGCFITGQAAGVGAALAVEGRCAAAEVNVGKVREVLRYQGQYIP